MGRKQYKVGKDFEEELCWLLSNNGYYVIYNEKRNVWQSAGRHSRNKK